jgi:succinate dehydrogenase hydrophobic anchor subunit
MTNLRAAFTSLAVVLLALGWLGAALASMSGEAAAWAEKVDGPQAGPIRLLALVVLLGAVALSFVPDRETPGDR